MFGPYQEQEASRQWWNSLSKKEKIAEKERLRRLADPTTPEGYAQWKGTAGPGAQLRAIVKAENERIEAKKGD